RRRGKSNKKPEIAPLLPGREEDGFANVYEKTCKKHRHKTDVALRDSSPQKEQEERDEASQAQEPHLFHERCRQEPEFRACRNWNPKKSYLVFVNPMTFNDTEALAYKWILKETIPEKRNARTPRAIE